MSNVPITEYEDAKAEVWAVYDEILAARGPGQISRFGRRSLFIRPLSVAIEKMQKRRLRSVR